MKGHIRKRGKDSWAIVIDLGRDSAGKRRQKWHTVHGTRKNAETELTRLLHQLDSGTYVRPTKMTVEEYLERWLKDYAEHNVAAKTFERYAEIARKHLAPNLGHFTLAKLHPLHIQEYYSLALERGRRDGSGGLSAQTVVHHHRLLRTALQQAVKWQLLARNPADAVEPPRPRHKEVRALDEGETAKLLNAAKGKRLYMPVLLAVTTGLRRGEILGLKWSDIDLQDGTLAVRRSLEQTSVKIAFKEPKSARSRRMVDLPQLTADALKWHRSDQARERLRAGAAYQELNLVCCMADGSLWQPTSLTHSFVALVHGIKLPRIRFHDLRHSHATHLLHQGVHPKVVSERLGHSTVGITLDVYSHVLPGLQKEAAKRVDQALRIALGGISD
jgi:integrase